MKRGEIWTAVFSGDYGKPRPALVIQSDQVEPQYPSIFLSPITSEITENRFRLTLEPLATTGLRKPSQVMIDKTGALAKSKVRKQIGRIDERQLELVEQTLLYLVGAAQVLPDTTQHGSVST